jgi:hypothetical protein
MPAPRRTHLALKVGRLQSAMATVFLRIGLTLARPDH